MNRKAVDIGGIFVLGDDKKGSGFKINTDKKYTSYINSGRNALKLILDYEKFDMVFVSSYNCYTVIEQFEKHCINIKYFSINSDFSINISFLKDIPINKSVCVLVQNYFSSYNLDYLKLELKKFSNVTVIEDITHSMYDKRIFENADYYVGSLRKWAGIGDGGLIISNIDFSYLADNDNEIINNYKYIKPIQLDFYLNGNKKAKEEFRVIQKETDVLFKNKEIQKISLMSYNLLQQLDKDTIQKTRRNNYKYVVSKLKSKKINIPIKKLEDASVPLYLPIYTDNRDALQMFLFQFNIYFPIIWPQYESVKNFCNESVEYIYNHILCIVIDQRYSTNDMKKIVDAINLY